MSICIQLTTHSTISVSIAYGQISSLHLEHVANVLVQQLQPGHLLTIELGGEVDSQLCLLQRHVQGVAATKGNERVLSA